MRFRNRGDGRFEDVTLKARAEMGRWAWSSDALDFDSDGWEDLYVANGMLTRESGPEDLDGFFWRQVVARSPLQRVTGAPYDEAWRAINQLLIHGSIASRQRNVFLRNDGRGGFDDVSGAVGLDLDQDGRSFAVLDVDRDGDPDLVLLAAATPQLRVFRNDFEERGAALAISLVGTSGNRDAVGARVTVETDRLRRTKVVQAGSGFLSQHSKELLFGLGASQRVVRVTVEWPGGRTQTFTDPSLNQRLRLQEGGEPRAEPFHQMPPLPGDVAAPEPASPPNSTWLYEPFPAPDFSLEDMRGENRSLSGLRERPAVVLFWAAAAPASRPALMALDEGAEALARAGIASLAVALDPSEDLPKVRAAASGVATVPVLHATPEVGLSYAILNRHLFMNRQALRLPTAFLLDANGNVVKAYRDRLDVSEVRQDAARTSAPPAERLARAFPFEGMLLASLGQRNYLPYGRELCIRASRPRPSPPSREWRRAIRAQAASISSVPSSRRPPSPLPAARPSREGSRAGRAWTRSGSPPPPSRTRRSPGPRGPDRAAPGRRGDSCADPARHRAFPRKAGPRQALGRRGVDPGGVPQDLGDVHAVAVHLDDAASASRRSAVGSGRACRFMKRWR